MLKWLPADDPCPVPYAAHTMVGVGGMVVNSKKEILVIREKYYKKPHWKLPGGYVDPGDFMEQKNSFIIYFTLFLPFSTKGRAW